MNDLWSPSPVNSFSIFVWKEGCGSWRVTISRDSQVIIGTCYGSVCFMSLLSWMLTVLLFHEILGWIVPLNRCSVSLVKYQMQHSNKSCKCHQLIVTAYWYIQQLTASFVRTQRNRRNTDNNFELNLNFHKKLRFHDKEDHNLKKCSHQPQCLRQSNDILPTQCSDSLLWSQSNDDDNCDHEMIRKPQETVCYRRHDGDPGDLRDPVPVPGVSVTLSRTECKKSDRKLRFNWQEVVWKFDRQFVN